MSLANEKPVDACSVDKLHGLQKQLIKVLQSEYRFLDIWLTGERIECTGSGDDEDQDRKEFETTIKIKLENMYITRTRKLAYLQGVEVLDISENRYETRIQYGEYLLVPFCSSCNPICQPRLSGTKCSTQVKQIRFTEKIQYDEVKQKILQIDGYPIERVSPPPELFRPDYAVIEMNKVKLQTMVNMVEDCVHLFD